MVDLAEMFWEGERLVDLPRERLIGIVGLLFEQNQKLSAQVNDVIELNMKILDQNAMLLRIK